jgi:predicted DNA-binding protein YlxM (UPF0122 family)
LQSTTDREFDVGPALPRRKLKELEKQKKVLHRYYNDLVKPAAIAKELKISREFVYSTVEHFKKSIK